jgi:alcohol dehydrogenase (cytochrome c)
MRFRPSIDRVRAPGGVLRATPSLRILLLALPLLALPIVLAGESRGVAPADLLKPLADTWPTYSGDYTGRRYSALSQINQTTVKGLGLAWVAKLTAGAGTPGGFGGFGRFGGGPPVVVGGEGSGDLPPVPANVKGTPLMANGVLYVTSPDNTWALDARDGRELWHYFWKTKGSTPIANRGVGLWNDYVFFVTPDNFFVSLDAKTGKERWHKVHADFSQQYFSTMAPIVVGNHVLLGTGNDLDSPGYVQSFDPETGEVKWRFYTVPMKQGDPGLDTWPSLDAARHGGGHPWLPGVYDPETKLYIFGTGNPIPAYTAGRGEGDNLFTCSLVAVHVETGKMAWYFQTSPHDMHDWDSAQTPILIDTVIDGKPRKLVSTAARNGYFFTLDRVTGQHIVTTKYGSAANWVKSVDKKGSLRRDPDKDPLVAGALVSPGSEGTINWEPPAYSPDTGFFYVAEKNGYSIFYLTDPDPRGSMGLGGKEEVRVGSGGSFLTAIDPRNGKVAWRRPYPGGGFGGGGGGLLTTAGKLVFSGDAGGNIVAYDAVSGKPLWHSRIGSVSNAPITYMLDGRQHLLVAAGDTLFAFALYE